MPTNLVERAMTGDQDAFTRLVDMHGSRCYAIAYRILRDLPRAEDAVQQAFLSAWRELPRLRDPERFDVWLHRLLVNACYEEARRNKRWTSNIRELPIEGPGGPDEMARVDDRDALERAFRQLSTPQRAVFILHHHVGMPLATIAEVVGAPIGTVKSRLFYATRKMRAVITSGELDVPEARPA